MLIVCSLLYACKSNENSDDVEITYGESEQFSDSEMEDAVDMGAVGDDLNGSEYKVSICAKDSTGPYDYDRTGSSIIPWDGKNTY